MPKTMTICNHCAGKIVLSLKRYVERNGLKFCSERCADAFFDPDNPEPDPIGLADELGLETTD